MPGERTRNIELCHETRLFNVFNRQTRIRDDRRNPPLPYSVIGLQDPDFPNRAPGRAAAPEKDGKAAGR